MNDVTYELSVTAPVETIVELYKAGGWWQEGVHAREIIGDMMRGSFCFMLARDEKNRIVGMARVISDGVSDAYIQDVVVLKEYRRLGIGRELIRRLTEFCLRHKIGWIGLVAEPGTQKFYEDLGFKELEGYRPMLFTQSHHQDTKTPGNT